MPTGRQKALTLQTEAQQLVEELRILLNQALSGNESRWRFAWEKAKVARLTLDALVLEIAMLSVIEGIEEPSIPPRYLRKNGNGNGNGNGSKAKKR